MSLFAKHVALTFSLVKKGAMGLPREETPFALAPLLSLSLCLSLLFDEVSKTTAMRLPHVCRTVGGLRHGGEANL